MAEFTFDEEKTALLQQLADLHDVTLEALITTVVDVMRDRDHTVEFDWSNALAEVSRRLEKS